MFGYVTIDPTELPKHAQERYQAYYCGLCRTLYRRYGNLGRATLSFDMTFLLILLSSLYEPAETLSRERCLPHPVRVAARGRGSAPEGVDQRLRAAAAAQRPGARRRLLASEITGARPLPPVLNFTRHQTTINLPQLTPGRR